MANPFDFNEDEASRQFEKSITLGISPHDSTESSEFLKKSMARTYMNDDSDDRRSMSVSYKKKPSFSNDNADAVSIQSKSATAVTSAKPVIKYNSSDLIKSARSNHTRASSGNFTRGSFETLDDVVHNKGQISSSEYLTLQDELMTARQTIEILRAKKWTNLPIKETIKNMVTGKSYSLEGYKSYRDKQSLLSEAVKSNDGDAVLAVVLFLERTLKLALFHGELRKTQIACCQYTNYLRKLEDWLKLEELFKYLLRYEDAALLRYERIHLISDSKEKIEELYKWIKDYGSKNELAELTSYVKDEIGLIEKQRQIEEEDKVKASSGNEVTMKYHQRPPVLLKPLVTTVAYCALFHYDKSDKYFPNTFKKSFRLTDKQYEWAVLPPLANRHRWVDVQELFTSTSWLFKKGEASHMGFEYVVTILDKAKANEEVMSKYLSLISNTDARFKFSSRYQMHDIAIQALVDLRDRHRMEDYRLKIGGTSSKHRQRINDLLNNTQIKWR